MIQQIDDAEIKNARVVLNDHLVTPLNREGALESLLFCIASQATRWEVASRFIYNLRNNSHGNTEQYASWEDLTNKDKVNETAHKSRWRFAYGRRFDSSIDYFRDSEGEWWTDVANADAKSREDYCKDIKWLSRKTFSFWHLCLGGKNLLALDVYVSRGLNELGVKMNHYFFKSQPIKTGNQNVRRTPVKKEYLRIENSARKLFSADERFLLDNGEVDIALVDSFLWWKGANRKGVHQMNIFGDGADSWVLPYSGYSPTFR